VALLKEDATLSMPPFPSWFWGREAIRAILTSKLFGSGVQQKWRLSPTGANAQPAFALYRADESQGFYRAFGIQVVTLDGSAPARPIAAVTIFNIPSLVTLFGFPLQLPG
jgi:RNA polymerase sigma-70 factor, ECF subfamily